MDISKAIARKSHPQNAAFSLVEIVLAIGIVSFAFVAIFGLIPTGLTSFRQAMEISVTSQVAQRVMNAAQQTDFATLTSSAAAVRYFDDQGMELPATQKSQSIYQVITRVKTPVDLGGSSVAANSNAAAVVVQVATNPANKTLAQQDGLFVPSSSVRLSTYSALVARTE